MSSRPKIFLVDDDPAVRASLAFSLELEGFLIETFDCAEDLADVASFPANGCLVVDYRLPGMDGISLLRSLRRRGVGLPAVLITSAPTRTVHIGAAETGAAIVEKPLLCDALTAAVRSGLERRPKAA